MDTKELGWPVWRCTFADQVLTDRPVASSVRRRQV